MALPRSAGILIPLFSLRTREDLGRGEILDLKSMIDFALAMGHRVIQLLPIDETSAEELSPYSALSIFAIDPIYISVHSIDGVGPVVMRRARKAVGPSRVVPRAIARNEKLKLLERAFRASRRGPESNGPDAPAFDAFVEANRDWLYDYALFRALKERFAWKPWEEWRAEIARRDTDALKAARRDLASAIAMYTYWQFLAHQQWTAMRAYATARGVTLGGDLAFSPGHDSAEVWANQSIFDLTRTVGAPPDAFNLRGQRWGLPMPNWARMRAQGFRFWRARARRASALYDLIRIDHVVGLYRTFNFGVDAEADAPGEFAPVNEDAQRTQGEEVMRAIKEEVGATEVVAEDLGTVPPWVRESLTAMGVPGYKVLQWERKNWDQPNESYISPAAY
ncbi:MAG TPA: 4-alpha-glucanotransferase, partial [Candidatus Binataceae bacterium]